jgi:putative oxidoreductase
MTSKQTAGLPVTLIIPELGTLYHALEPCAEALLRAAVGLALVPHGLRLFFGFFPGTGVNIGSFVRFADVLDKTGYRPGKFWAVPVLLTEFVAGPLMALGLLTRPAALAVFILMLLSTVDHIKDGYFWNTRGIEYPAMWAIAALYFVLHGGGVISLDRLIGWEF